METKTERAELSRSPQSGPTPNTVPELIAAAREKAKTSEQKDVIDYVLTIAKLHNIRLRHDRFKPVAQPAKNGSASLDLSSIHFASGDFTCESIYEDESITSESSVTSTGTVYNKRPHETKDYVHRLNDGSHVLILEEIIGDACLRSGQSTPVPWGSSLDDDTHSCRLVLSCDRKTPRTGTPFNTACNGYVIDTRSWTPLVIPPRAFTADVRAVDVNKMLDKDSVDIIQIDDMTVVTFYSWEHPTDGPIWDLASSNAYSVSSLKWMGPKTYAEIVYEIALMYPEFITKAGVTLVRKGTETRIELANMDRGKCYTIGFRHHTFHPLRCDPQRMLQIQTVNLATGKVTYGGELPGVPAQTVLSPDALAAKLKSVANTSAGPITKLRYESLAAHGDSALDVAKAFVKRENGKPGKDADGLPPQLHYGYILRSKDAEGSATPGAIDVLIESTLLKRVRQTVYERPPREIRQYITYDNRLEYNAVKSLVSFDRETFETLFPQWSDTFRVYDDIIGNVVTEILHIYRQHEIKSSHVNRSTPTHKFATALCKHIIQTDPLGKEIFNQKNARSIIRDYVMSANHAYLLLELRSRKST